VKIAIVLVLVACSAPPAKPQTLQRTTTDNTCEEVAWSCVGITPNTTDAWGCIEGNSSQTAQYQASCTEAKHGRFALNACLRDTMLGGCTLARGSQCTSTWYAPPATRDSIEADCVKQGALFVAP
jgi:hypothetical protein